MQQLFTFLAVVFVFSLFSFVFSWIIDYCYTKRAWSKPVSKFLNGVGAFVDRVFVIIVASVALVLAILTVSHFSIDDYDLHKYYNDPNSPAAVFRSETGDDSIVDEYDTRDSCTIAKRQAEYADIQIGYDNSLFVCEKAPSILAQITSWTIGWVESRI